MIVNTKVTILTPLILRQYRNYVKEYARVSDSNKVEYQKLVNEKLQSVLSATVSAGSSPSINIFTIPTEDVRNSFIRLFSTVEMSQAIEEDLSKSRRQIKQIIVSDSSLFETFYKESSSTDISVIADGLAKYYKLTFTKESFRSRDFSITWNPSTETFITKLSPKKDNEISSKVRSAADEFRAKTIAEFEEGLTNLKKSGLTSFSEFTVDIGYLGGNGITTSSASLSKEKEDFIAGRFVSSMDLTILIRREIRRRMRPTQPPSVPGRPPIMTTRTGMFRESFTITALDYRRGVMNYFYLPYYDKNMEYGYEVSSLVQGSIRYVLQQRLRRQLNLIRELDN